MSSWKLILLLLVVYNAHAGSHCSSKRGNTNSHPSAEELKQLADAVLSKITVENNAEELRFDAKMDTIAVGLSNGGLLITGNVKERRIAGSSAVKGEYIEVKLPEGGKAKMTYVNYGLTEALSKVAIEEVKKSATFQRNPMDITVIEEKLNPIDNPNLTTMMDKAADHASKHAETKMQAYCAEIGQKLEIIGISKPPCQGCYKDLSDGNVVMSPDTPGLKYVRNRRPVDKNEVEVRSKYTN